MEKVDKISIIEEWTDNFVTVEVTGGTYYCIVSFNRNSFHWSTKNYTRLTDAVDSAYLMVAHVVYDAVQAIRR